MKKIILLCALYSFTSSFISCKDSVAADYLIVNKVEKTSDDTINKYYVNFETRFGGIGLYTNTNYKVGDTLK